MRERVEDRISWARTAARRRAAQLPEPMLERVRLAEAWRLETRVRRSTLVRGVALVFHAVAPSGGDARVQLDPPLAAARLDAMVGYLAVRYRLVRAGELPQAASARRPRQPLPVAVTFDDDLPSHHELAAPILRRHGAVATVFLCGAHSPFWWQLLQVAVDTRAIDAQALAPLPAALVEAALQRDPGAIAALGGAIEKLAPAQRDELVARLERAIGTPPPLLSAQGRIDLAAAGWEIGFHTRRHDLLTTLDDDALRVALDDGRQDLGAGAIATLAYPHGKAGVREARAARQAGFVAAYTTAGKVFTENTDAHLIGRLYPDTATVGRFALALARALAA
ncbi:MAG TPA: polysaccharide deacetylase family protein [Solirubrobacteraceae bacterium]|nr:polysaccharide deacetylase family protein [Solirubrobacteraceae bacterium]